MSYRITNRSRMPVLLRFRGGTTLHLPPGARSGELEGADVVGNRRIERLGERRLIDIEEVAQRGGPSRGGRPRRSGRAGGTPDAGGTEAGSNEAPESES